MFSHPCSVNTQWDCFLYCPIKEEEGAYCRNLSEATLGTEKT